MVGSIPTLGTKMCGINSVVECHLAKVKVASSNLVSRSTTKETAEGNITAAVFIYGAIAKW